MQNLANGLFGLSVLAVILSMIGALGKDLWLASSQWVLVAAVLAIWAVYLKIRA